MPYVNIWAVLAAAVASMVIGSIWYGPLFGKIYIRAMGWDKRSPEEQKAMMKGAGLKYLWQFIASIVTFFVLAWLISALHMTSVEGGIQSAFWVWLGFILPLKLGDSLWGGKKALFWLGASNSLVTMLIGGIIIGAWK